MSGYADIDIKDATLTLAGLSADSNTLKPNEVFFALQGHIHHGLDFIKSVLNKKPAAIIWEPPHNTFAQHYSYVGITPCIAVPELKHKIGFIASRFYDEPSRKMHVIGLTGTDGKTSCSYFIAQALSNIYHNCGIIGTLGNGIYGKKISFSSYTTPDAVTLQRSLATIRDHNSCYVVMEVSSHALVQGRIEGVNFTSVVLTNFTRDHLDYHGNLYSYKMAKKKLFCEYSPSNIILNMDDQLGQELAQDLSGKNIIGYGLVAKNYKQIPFVSANQVKLHKTGIRFLVESSWGNQFIQTNLFGSFNVNNMLATIATLLSMNIPLSQVLGSIKNIHNVIGRMESFGGTNKYPLIIIDYAHTPNALKQVLISLKKHHSHSHGKIKCVFGCGGNRDAGKRPLMGEIAEKLADEVFLTDDNPRTENPDKIICDILSGMQYPNNVTIIRDRRSAIQLAVNSSDNNDIVLIAGKGHEQYQIFGNEIQLFSDRSVVQQLLNSY